MLLAIFIIFPFIAAALDALLALRLFVANMGDPRAYILGVLPTITFLWLLHGPGLLTDHAYGALIYGIGIAVAYCTVIGTILHVPGHTSFWRHGLLCLVLTLLAIIPVGVSGSFFF